MAKVGRPLLYKSVDDLSKIIDEYFDWCDNRMGQFFNKDKGENTPFSDPAPYTMSGLARRLGMDRRTLLDYSKRDEFLPTIKAARDRVHEDVETRLMGKNATGAIFNLKNNFDWRDKTETDLTSGGDKINTVMYLPEKLPDDYGSPKA